MGRLAEAEAELADVIAEQTRRLGADHIDTLRNRPWRGVLLQDLGRSTEVEAELLAAVADLRRFLGEGHPLTIQHGRHLTAVQRDLGPAGGLIVIGRSQS